MLLLHIAFKSWKRRRELFGDKVVSKTWLCDKINIVYCLNNCLFGRSTFSSM